MSRLLPFGRIAVRQFSTLKNNATNKVLLNKKSSNLKQLKRFQSEWVKPFSGAECAFWVVTVGGGFTLWGFYLAKLMFERYEAFDARPKADWISFEELQQFKAELERKRREEEGDDEDEEEEDNADEDNAVQAEQAIEEAFEDVEDSDIIRPSSKDTVIFIDPPKE